MTNQPSSSVHLDIGGVINRAGSIYKETALAIWGAALVIMVPAYAVIYLIQGVLLKNPAGSLIGNIISLVASAWLTGAVIRVVQDVIVDNRYDLTIPTLLKPVLPKLITLIVIQLIMGFCIVLLSITIIGIPFAIYLYTRWVVSLQAVIIEDKGIFDALGRSSELTKDNKWRILGLVAVLALMILAVMLVFTLLGMVLPILGVIAGLIALVAVWPFLASIGTVLYYELLPGDAAGQPVAVEEVTETVVEEQ